MDETPTWLPPSADPGWRPAFRGSWRFFLPWLLPLTARKAGNDPLVMLRSLFLSFSATLVLIGVVVVVLDNGAPEDAGGMPTAVGAAMVCLVGVAGWLGVRLVERPLDCSGDVALHRSYRTRFFFRLALAESAALTGFVAFFVTGDLAMYPLGLAFTAVGFVGLAPTAGNLGRDQQDLTTAGCARSLIAALRQPTEAA